jgi:palmitoyltransferase ZDHHC4
MLIFICVLGIGLLIYTLLFGQTQFHENGIVGKLYRGISSLPGLCRSIVSRLCGSRVSQVCGDAEQYCCLSIQPFMQIFYLLLVIGGFIWTVATLFAYVSLGERIVCHALLYATLATFCYASLSEPGHLNALNVSRYAKMYKADGVLHARRPRFCNICRIDRPPRAKHCFTCQRCTSRFDHHCMCLVCCFRRSSFFLTVSFFFFFAGPWTNCCVGANNLRLFLAFLLQTALLCVYVSALCYSVLSRFVDVNQFWRPESHAAQLAGGEAPGYALLARYLLFFMPTVVTLMLFATCCAIILVAFAGYHCYLIARNTTTYETFHWRLIDRLFPVVRAQRREQASLSPSPASGGGGESRSNAVSVEQAERLKHHELANRLRAYLDANPNAERVSNAYDRGVFANFAEILWPAALYR